MNGNTGILVITEQNISHYHDCADEEYNAEYLNAIGFPMETAIEIAAWAALAAEGDAYEQNERPEVKIYIL